jgi:DNA-binding MarR family transcriptional regulator
LKLERFLPFKLSVASNRVSQRIAATYEEGFGLSMTAWRVMAVLGERPGESARNVAALTALDKVAVSRAVRILDELGYLVREASPLDGRQSRLSLSAAGQKAYREIIPKAIALEDEINARLTRKEKEVLDQVLDRLMTLGAP